MKLSPDQKDSLRYCLYDTASWSALQAFLASLEMNYSNRVLSYDLSSGSDRELALIKARSEGVTSFIQNIKIKRDMIVKENY